MPVPLTLALTQQSAAAAVGGGITVTLQQPAATSTAMANGVAATVAVTVPQAVAQQAEGFNFPLPAAVQQAVRQAVSDSGRAATATGPSGDPLPAWLRFDAESLRFLATRLPAGALPYRALLRFGDQSVLVVVSETES